MKNKTDVVQIVMNRLKAAKEVVYDAETSGLDWKRNCIVGHVLTFSANPDESFYIPVRHAAGGNIGGQKGPQAADGWDGNLHKIEKDLLKYLDRPDLTVIGFNIGFDLKFLFRLGYTFKPRHEDGMVNAALIDEWQGKFSLEFCANKAGVQAKKSEAMTAYLCSKFSEAAAAPRSAMGSFWRLRGDDPVAVDYATGDGTSTWQLRNVQMLELEKQELMRVWDIESRLIPVLARMTTKGIKVDVPYLEGLKKKVESDVEALMNEFPSGFAVRSANDVKTWMEKHGHTDWPLTPKKQAPSFPENWLERYPSGQKIIKVRKLDNLKNSFIVPLLETHLWKGRVHPNYNQLRNDEYGTITGRLSSDSPNFQQVPKHNYELGKLFRRAFIPDDGKTWASVDMSQAEPRLLTYYSRCKVLLDGYRADPPIDAHTAAAEACNKNWPNMSKDERKHYRDMTAKRINMLVITGGGKGALMAKFGLDQAEVDKMWNDYHRALPEVKIIQKKMERRMMERGYIMTLLGRRCRLKDRDKAYVALNRALQGGNADCLKVKAVEIGEFLEANKSSVNLMSNCHDAFDMQFAEADRAIFQQCCKLMASFGENDVIKLDIPMPVDIGEGKDWSAATYGEEK